MSVFQIVCVVLLGLMFLFVGVLFLLPKKVAAPLPCSACGRNLMRVGFVSWNGGSDGLGLMTNGVAAPTESFVARLREAANRTPAPSTPGHMVRMVGQLVLLDCQGCKRRFTQDHTGVNECTAEQWADLVGRSATQ